MWVFSLQMVSFALYFITRFSFFFYVTNKPYSNLRKKSSSFVKKTQEELLSFNKVVCREENYQIT